MNALNFKYALPLGGSDKGEFAPGPTDGGLPLRNSPTVHIETTGARAVRQVSWPDGPTGTPRPTRHVSRVEPRRGREPWGMKREATHFNRWRTSQDYATSEPAGDA